MALGAEVGQGIHEADFRTAEKARRPRSGSGVRRCCGRRYEMFYEARRQRPVNPPPPLKGRRSSSRGILAWHRRRDALVPLRSEASGWRRLLCRRRELGHIHLDGEIHLGATRTLAAMLIEHDLAGPFEWDDAWVQYPICAAAGGDTGEANLCRSRKSRTTAVATRQPGDPNIAREANVLSRCKFMTGP